MNLGAVVSNAIRAVPSALRTTVIVGRTVQGTLDPATNVRTGDGIAAFSVRAVVLADEDKGVPSLERTRNLLVAAADCAFEPQSGDYVTSLAPEPTIKWRVLAAKPTGTDGTAALYRITVGR
jgi:hypothetical protein